jgi:cell wall-associated NlpC family hydrolase
VRFRTAGSTVLCVLALVALPATATAATGGVSASATPKGAVSSASPGGTTPVATTPAAPTPKRHTAPVTSRSSSLAYKGAVFQKTPTGQVVPYVSPSVTGELSSATGGNVVGALVDTKPELLVPGTTARVVGGLAAAPMSAPAAIQEIVWAGNQIIGLPYIFGGGHGSFTARGYDCSGTVSFALHGAKLLSTPEDSSEFMHWGSHGLGTWVTVFSNPGHAYMTVAGLRLDTSAADDPSNQQGPRWRPLRRANGGYSVRHPTGL